MANRTGIQTPRNLYSEGAVTFNTNPSLQFYANLLQRNQAKQDALDQYYQKALTEVTPTGMRSNDINSGWAKKLQDWQNFGMAHKEQLMNPRSDNYKALTDFNNMHADLLNDVQKSKDAAAQQKEAFQLKKTGKWNPTGEVDQNTGKFTPGSDLDIQDRLSKSIYDPTRMDENGQEPDISQFSVNAPPLTGQQLLQYSKYAEGGAKRGKQKTGVEPVSNPVTGKVEQQYQDVFTPTQIKNNAETYATLVGSNKSLYNHYNNMLHSGDLEHIQRLNDAYKSVYPNGTMDNPVEVAKAEKIMIDSTPSNVRMEPLTDTELQYQRSLNKIRANAEAQGTYSKFNDVAGQLSSDINDNNAQGITYVTGNKLKRSADVFIKEAENKYPNKVLSQDDIKVRKDGGNFEVSYSDSYLSKHPNVQPLITTMTPNEVNAAANKSLGVSASKSSMKPTMGTTPSTTVPAAPKSTYKYNGKTFTIDQIKKAAQQNNVSVDEYIKRAGIQ